MRKLYLLVLVMACRPGFAQEEDTTTVTLQPVQIHAAVIDADIPATSSSPGVSPLLNVVNGLNAMPGVSSQEGAANTAKFTYRGFGARSQYTTSRTLFYLDNIPITGLQGFSTFEDINPVYIGRVELHQPGTNFYPSALGGAVKLATSDAYILRGGKSEFKNQFTTGSFGLIGNNLLYTNENQAMTVGYENLQREGWRENSALKRQSLFFNSKRLFGKNLQLLLYGIKNRSEIPSSLSQKDFENNPEKAADSWGEIEGFEKYDKLITGLTWSNRERFYPSPVRKNIYSVTAFYQYRNGFEPRPFNILDDESHQGGFRGYYRHHVRGIGSLQVFTEYHMGTEEASTFQNLYDSISNTHNNKGAQINNTKQMSQLVNSGLSWAGRFSDSSIFKRFGYRMALNSFYRYNTFENGAQPDYGSPFVLAPRVSVNYRPKSTQSFRNPKVELAVYKAYSIPSLEENLDPDGSLNAGLKPEDAWTVELGLEKGTRDRLNLYYSEVQNLIVPKVVGPDQVVATNSGSSRHAGVELSYGILNYINLKDRSSYKDETDRTLSFSLKVNGYYGYFAYKRFSDTAGAYNGNRLPGFPEWQGTVRGEISWERYKWIGVRKPPLQKLTLGLQAQATGGYYINDQNTVRNEPFFLLQTWLGYQHTFKKHWMFEIKGGVKNLTDTKYAGMTVVNNQAFGNSQPRFYYPGDPINWFSTVSLAYRF